MMMSVDTKTTEVKKKFPYRESQKRWNSEHRDILNQRAKNHYRNNEAYRKKRLEQMRAYYAKKKRAKQEAELLRISKL